jgi:hypothetical protein
MAKRKRPSKVLQSTAYHEAGHAVVRWYGKLKRPKYATIIEGEDYLGAVAGLDVPSGFDPDTKFSGRTQLILERRIRTFLAGSVAQKKFNPSGFRKYNAADDEDKAHKNVLWLSGNYETASAYMKLLRLQTRDILNKGWIWKCVEAVAEALLDKKKLSGEETWQIINATITQQQEGGPDRDKAQKESEGRPPGR